MTLETFLIENYRQAAEQPELLWKIGLACLGGAVICSLVDHRIILNRKKPRDHRNFSDED